VCMFIGKDLLALGLMAAALWFVVRAVRPPAVLGRAGPAPPCEVPVERGGEGVTCLDRAEAARRGLRAGAGMRPERLAAWGAPVVKLADALVAHDRADEAVQACRRGLAARPDDIPMRLALGRALSAAGHLEEAQAALLDAVSRQKAARDAGPPRGPKPAPAPTPLRPLE